MKYVRQKEASLLGEADAAIVAKARDLYGEAVEASMGSALKGSKGVVGDRVRQAFAQVTLCSSRCTGAVPHSGITQHTCSKDKFPLTLPGQSAVLVVACPYLRTAWRSAAC